MAKKPGTKKPKPGTKRPKDETPPAPVPRGKRPKRPHAYQNRGAATRTVDQIEIDQAAIAEMMSRGFTNLRITDAINSVRPYKLSTRTIRHDMEKIRQKWHTAQMESLTVHINRELQLLDYLQVEALDGWERSKAEKQKSEAEKADFSDQGKRAGTRSKLTRENRDGTPEFLAVALKCSERRCRILGLDAPTKSEHSGPDGMPLPLPPPSAVPHLVEIRIISEEEAHAAAVQAEQDPA